jgi:hypothetical protein
MDDTKKEISQARKEKRREEKRERNAHILPYPEQAMDLS